MPLHWDSSDIWRKDDSFITLTLLVGWQEEHASHKKAHDIYHQRSLPEEVEDENREGTAYSRFTWKTAVKTEVM